MLSCVAAKEMAGLTLPRTAQLLLFYFARFSMPRMERVLIQLKNNLTPPLVSL